MFTLCAVARVESGGIFSRGKDELRLENASTIAMGGHHRNGKSDVNRKTTKKYQEALQFSFTSVKLEHHFFEKEN